MHKWGSRCAHAGQPMCTRETASMQTRGSRCAYAGQLAREYGMLRIKCGNNWQAGGVAAAFRGSDRPPPLE
eukprot:1190102-Prorocentrum_minimum.AAC.1